MKRLIHFISISAIVALVAVSCSKLNEFPVFNDADAFVAFNKTSLSISEQGGILNIPVTLASVGGITSAVTYNVIDGTAKSGINFRLVDGSATLNFTAAEPTQNIQIEIINVAGVFTGDIKFTVELANAGSVNLGFSKTCSVTINDEDHPLSAILGSYSAKGSSYFNGAEQWTMELTKDASDISKVWIGNFVAGGSNKLVYGIVNNDMTVISVPKGQAIASSSSYGYIELRAFYGPDGADEIPEGGVITIQIAADKKSMTIMDEIGSYVWQNADKTGGLGWYNIFQAGIIMTKK